MGVAVTSDSSFVIVADCLNHRVQVLRLVVGADGTSAHLEFVRSLGSGVGTAEGKLFDPYGVALLQSNGGQQETVLVTEQTNQRVSQFALDTFVGIFAGTGKEGSGDGEFNYPRGITVLGSSGEVAIADRDNHRVQIFDSEGNYKRQFGTEGKEDGQFNLPSGLASDAHGNLLVTDSTNRLQVFDPEGKHLCTRSDLGLHRLSRKGIAWSTGGEIAVANGNANKVVVWHSA
jgi:DNA-binding beta-propeller fold protein YncE